MKLLSQRAPVGVKKMSTDPGEKFWLSYWDLEGGAPYSNMTRRHSETRQDIPEAGNSTISLTPAFPIHFVEEPGQFSFKRSLLFTNNRQLLSKRDYRCPANSSPCNNIGRPDRCCGNGDTCQLVTDTGLGDVGCCSGDNQCASGSLDTCPWGYNNCAGNYGGGCCIPGYECVSEGCMCRRFMHRIN